MPTAVASIPRVALATSTVGNFSKKMRRAKEKQQQHYLERSDDEHDHEQRTQDGVAAGEDIGSEDLRD
jgi:hypothetical protein